MDILKTQVGKQELFVISALNFSQCLMIEHEQVRVFLKEIMVTNMNFKISKPNVKKISEEKTEIKIIINILA